MTFIHKIFCDQCNEEVADIFKHDCPESPENVAKREEASRLWEEAYSRMRANWDEANKLWAEAYSRMSANWDEWEDGLDCALDYARPPIMEQLHDVAIKGPCVVVSLADRGSGIDYIGPEFVNPTWATLTLVLEKAIRVTRDIHHCFLEGVIAVEREDLPRAVRKQITSSADIYLLETGS
jgi:hypothetical protein